MTDTTVKDRLKLIREQKQKTRMKVSNLVSRKKLNKECCFCGEKATIVHNPDNPYYITFACNKCRKDKELMKTVDSYRFDIRESFDKKGLNFKFITDDYIINTVDGYLKDTVSIGTYCDRLSISRHQFGLMVDKYKTIVPSSNNITSLIDKHAHKIQQQSCRDVYDNRMRELGQPVPKRDKFGNNLDKKSRKSKSVKSSRKSKNTGK